MLPLGAVTDRRLAALRVILAVGGLLITYPIRSDPGRYIAVAYVPAGHLHRLQHRRLRGVSTSHQLLAFSLATSRMG